ncbi:MAG: YtxH domain-containing protein [Anaerolineae bacterium]
MKRLMFIVGFCVGACVGWVVGVLYVPQSGQRTREDLRDTGIELRPEILQQGEQDTT